MSYRDIKITEVSQSILVQSALMIAKQWCDRSGCYYSQPNRMGSKSYDCSSLMYRVWQACFNQNREEWAKEGITRGVIDVAGGGDMYTGTMYDHFTACGFLVLDTYLARSDNPTGLVAGDILLRTTPHKSAHTAMVFGRDPGGQLYLVEAGTGPAGDGGEGPSAYNGVGFARYWGKDYWQYVLRCPLGYTNAMGSLRKLQAERYVQKIYRTLLNREPEFEGLETWSSHLYDKDTGKHPYSIYWVLANILGSIEYLGLVYTNEQFIAQLYKLVLNRAPDPIGLENYLNFMKDNPTTCTITREDITRTISTRAYILYDLCRSSEAASGAISNLYGGLVMITNDEASWTKNDTLLNINMIPDKVGTSTSVYYRTDEEWVKATNIYVKTDAGWQTAKSCFVKKDNNADFGWLGG